MLEEIVNRKRQELAVVMEQVPLEELLGRVPDDPLPPFEDAVAGEGVNIIAEVKYASPSHGLFACRRPPVEMARVYREGGAAAVSVLTEKNYFAGDLQFLEAIHSKFPKLPLLRKDFIVDGYQITEARLKGASAYLLIVACLSPGELKSLISYGRDFGLDALVEVHDPFQLEQAVESHALLIGVNNRNLKTFEVDIQTSFELAKRMEEERDHTLVSESGIQEHSQIAELRDAGFSAFLVGSVLMEAAEPDRKLRELKGEE